MFPIDNSSNTSVNALAVPQVMNPSRSEARPTVDVPSGGVLVTPLQSVRSAVSQTPATTTSAEPKVAEASQSELQASQAELMERIAELNDSMQKFDRNLRFSVDESSGTSIIKVLDAQTDELIRQIPSEDVLSIREALEQARGLLFESKA